MLCFELSFGHRVLRVVMGIGFVLCPVIGDTAHDRLRVVATRKGTFGIRPIRFGLTPVPVWDVPREFLRFVQMTGPVGRVFVHNEVAKVIDLVRLLHRTNEKSLVVFPVPESGYAKHAGYVRRGWVTPKLCRQRAKQRFGLRLVETLHAPGDLIVFGRRVEHEIRNGNVSRRSNGMKRGRAVFVKVEIDVVNLKDALLGPRAAVMAEGIHSEKNVGTTFVSFAKPILKGRAGDDFRGKNPLHDLAARAVAEEQGYLVLRTMQRKDIFRGGK